MNFQFQHRKLKDREQIRILLGIKPKHERLLDRCRPIIEAMNISNKSLSSVYISSKIFKILNEGNDV